MFVSRIAHRIVNIPFVKRRLTERRWIVRLYFNARYLKENPYQVEEVSSEKKKYREIEKVLRSWDRIGSVLEVGAGEGFMTEILATYADRVTAVEISDVAASRARKRLEKYLHVTILRMDILSGDLGETFDLVVCSEVLYYFELAQLPIAIRNVIRWTRPGGRILIVHARALADDTSGLSLKIFGAKTIHEVFIGMEELDVLIDDVHAEYRLTAFQKDGDDEDNGR